MMPSVQELVDTATCWVREPDDSTLYALVPNDEGTLDQYSVSREQFQQELPALLDVIDTIYAPGPYEHMVDSTGTLQEEVLRFTQAAWRGAVVEVANTSPQRYVAKLETIHLAAEHCVVGAIEFNLETTPSGNTFAHQLSGATLGKSMAWLSQYFEDGPRHLTIAQGLGLNPRECAQHLNRLRADAATNKPFYPIQPLPLPGSLE